LPYKFWLAPKLRELNLSLNLLRDLPTRPNNTSITLSPLHKTNNENIKSKKSDSSVGSPSIEEIANDDEDFQLNDKLFRSNPNMVPKELNHVNLWSQNVEVVAASHNDEDSDARQQCNLVSLNLSHNGFQRIPPTLSCLAINLTRLNLSYNCLQSLGCIKSYPVNLKHVDLSQNQISEWFKVDFDCHLEPTTCYCDLNQSSSPKSSALSLKTIKSNMGCVHKQHNRLDNLRTLILANNKLKQIVINSEEKDNCEEFETLDPNNALNKGLLFFFELNIELKLICIYSKVQNIVNYYFLTYQCLTYAII
jgi:Leucine-rich repeat (LRR) protein